MGSQSVIVLDTHVLIWWVTKAPALTSRARHAIRQAVRHGPLAVSTVSLFEAASAVRRGRVRFGVPFDQWLRAVRALPELRFVPVNEEIASAAGGFDDSMPSDPADRIIAATTMALATKLVTADARLRVVRNLQTVW